MSIGSLEITFMAISWSIVALLHLAAHLVTRKNSQKLPKPLLLLYGLPACHTIACILTPPDLISSIILALPCIALYAVACGCALLLYRHAHRHPA